MEEGKYRSTAFVVAFVVAVLLSMALLGAFSAGHPSQYATISAPTISGAPASTVLNVTLSRVAYVTQPPQWQYSSTSAAVKETFSDSSAWVLNNSGYQFAVWNSTGTTAPGPAALNYNLTSYLGSTVNYQFLDSRFAVNGTGTTAYIVLSENSSITTTSPLVHATNGTAATAGKTQNMIWIKISEISKTKSSVLLGYYRMIKGGNGVYYDNYSSYAFSVDVLALNFYDFYFNLEPSTGSTFSIVNGTGSVLGTSPALYPVLANNTSKLTTATYLLSAAASTAGDMMILNYAYLVDHNSISSTTSAVPALAGAIAGVSSTAAPFDPGNSQANYTQSANASKGFDSTTLSSTDFASYTNSSDPSVLTGSAINVSQAPNLSQNKVIAQSALESLRSSADSAGSIQTNLYVDSWTSTGINASILSFLETYIGNKISVPPTQVTIISYVVSKEGFDIHFNANAMSEVQNYMYSAIPGILQTHRLSLVDDSTGAVVAGAAIGDFLVQGCIFAPEISGGTITDPGNGATYSSLSAAGFPAGTYVSGGAVIVPGQSAFYGFASDGLPIFAAGWNPFGGLSGAASAVGDFFQGGSAEVANAVGSVAATATPYVVESLNNTLGTSYNQFTSDVTKTGNAVMPFLGGAIGPVSSDVSGLITHTLSSVSSGYGSFRSSALGAMLGGVNDMRQNFLQLGSTALHNANATVAGIYNTAGAFTNDAEGVISPIVSAAENLPGVIVNNSERFGNYLANKSQSMVSMMKNIDSQMLSQGYLVMNGAAHTLINESNGILSWEGNAMNNMAQAATGYMNGPLDMMSSLANNVAHIIEYAVVGGIAVVVVIAALSIYTHSAKHGRRSRRRKK